MRVLARPDKVPRRPDTQSGLEEILSRTESARTCSSVSSGAASPCQLGWGTVPRASCCQLTGQLLQVHPLLSPCPGLPQESPDVPLLGSFTPSSGSPGPRSRATWPKGSSEEEPKLHPPHPITCETAWPTLPRLWKNCLPQNRSLRQKANPVQGSSEPLPALACTPAVEEAVSPNSLRADRRGCLPTQYLAHSKAP